MGRVQRESQRKTSESRPCPGKVLPKVAKKPLSLRTVGNPPAGVCSRGLPMRVQKSGRDAVQLADEARAHAALRHQLKRRWRFTRTGSRGVLDMRRALNPRAPSGRS